MKPTQCPAREKKNEARKAKNEGKERKRKVKVKTAVFVYFAFCAYPNFATTTTTILL